MSTQTPKDPLSTLLATTPAVRERGFRKRVMYRIHLRELRRRVIFFTAWCCGLVGIALSLPLERFGTTLLNLQKGSNVAWTDLANTDRIFQALHEYQQMSNFNLVVALSAGAVLMVLATFSLLQE